MESRFKGAMKTAMAWFVILALVGMMACKMPTDLKTESTGTDTSNVINTTVAGTAGVSTVVGSVHGIVYSFSGSPLANMPFAYATEGVTVSTAKALSDANARTNASGMFEVTGLASGDHTLVFGDGVTYTQSIRTVHVPTMGELRDMVQLGTALDGNGVPIGDATLGLSGNPVVSVSLDPEVLALGELSTLGSLPASPSVVTLYPLSYSGSRPIYYSGFDAAGTSKTALPAASTVIFDYGPFLLPRYKEFTLGSAGQVSFTGLPWGYQGPFSLIALLPDSTTAYASYETGGLVPAELLLSIAEAPAIISSLPVVPAVSTQYFDPGTVAAPTPFVLTFSREMDSSSGTVSLSTIYDGESPTPLYYDTTQSWNLAGTVLTVTPKVRLENGATATLLLSDFAAKDNTPMLEQSLSYNTQPVLELVGSNLFSPYNDLDGGYYYIPVASVLNLEFNSALSAPGADNYLVDDTGAIVPSAIAVSGKTLTITPTSNLGYDQQYTVYYDVGTGMFQGYDSASGSLSFHTARNTTALATPVLSLDNLVLGLNTGDTNYEYGDSTAYVSFTNLESANPSIAYYFQTKASTSANWSAPASITIAAEDKSSPILYSALSVPSVTPLYNLDIRVFARRTDGNVQSSPSNIQTISDTTAPGAPVVARGTYLAWGAVNNAAGTTSQSVTVRFSLPVSEPMTIPTASQVSIGGTLVGSPSILRVTNDSSRTWFEVTVLIPPGATVTNNYLRLPIQDARGTDSTSSSGGFFQSANFGTL